MKWIVENWMWVLFIGVPTLIAIGAFISTFTQTDKDDKFFAKAKKFWAGVIEGVSKIQSLPTPEDYKKEQEEDKKKK